MKIVVKGGIWKNTEDEILKAAVMKYGKNQWARISSLLVRKTPKQCKARWHEWLDPSIKKTEWTREEDEKLLHLAKIMPTQWRTIAPIIGRTASQCLERYEKLLDEAQGKDAADMKDDPRRLRPGEIDPSPESRAARPDPVDMDEDEKEMLSEARARLANTKGKKAKRKAREKSLEESRRMASLQKRRELKAAGITYRYHHKRKAGVDYMTEVPFQRAVPKGFFDTSADAKRTKTMKNDPEFLHKTIRELEGKRRDEVEEEARKKDAQREKLRKKYNLPEVVAQISAMNDPAQLRRREKMALPTPQVTEQELEQIAKLGNTVGQISAGSGATKTLLGTYQATPTPGVGRNMRTPMAENTILQEAQALAALTQAPTPLKGGDSTPLHKLDFSGITPKRQELRTPNVLSTPGGIGPSATPMTVHGTPVRDSLNINTDSTEDRRAALLVKKRLRAGLSELPAPKNEYALVMPELAPEPEHTEAEEVDEEQDAEIAQQRSAERRQQARERLYKKRSQPLQRGLPRPAVVNSAMFNGVMDDADKEGPRKLIEDEMVALLRHEAVKYNLDGSETKKRAPPLPEYDQHALDQAQKMVSDEAERLYAKNPVSTELYAAALDRVLRDTVYLPGLKTYGSLASASQVDRLAAMQQEYALTTELLTKDMKAAQKTENKLDILTGGFQKRVVTSVDEIGEVFGTLSAAATELACFHMLQAQEENGTAFRVQSLKREVQDMRDKESFLQQRYARLSSDIARVSALLQSNGDH